MTRRIWQIFCERLQKSHYDTDFMTLADILRRAMRVRFKTRRVRRKRRAVSRGSAAHYRAHKKQAREIVERKVDELNALPHYQFTIKRIAIRNQKSRWGSCSAKGNLNFNYKVALLPEHLCDYVVVHELCHLREFNHSRRFWDLVAIAVPDYRARRAELRSRYNVIHRGVEKK